VFRKPKLISKKMGLPSGNSSKETIPMYFDPRTGKYGSIPMTGKAPEPRFLPQII